MLRLGADERVVAGVRTKLAPDRVAPGEHAVPKKAKHPEREPETPAAVRYRDLAVRLPRDRGGSCAHELGCDLGARVSEADDEHRALAQLGRRAVLARVELHDARVEVVR